MESASAAAPTAAYFRVEGVLLRRGALGAAAYFAANKQGFSDRLWGIGAAALAAPVYTLLKQNDRTLANRVAWLPCRHMSEDRIVVLAEEYVEDVLKDKILARGIERIERARADGHRVVLLTEQIAPVAAALARHLPKVDETVCNRLEFRDGVATGKLEDPVLGGHGGGRWAMDHAAGRKIDLARSTAYASNGPDVTLLTAVGRPCAVNPDFTLRAAAREADWPVVEYDE